MPGTRVSGNACGLFGLFSIFNADTYPSPRHQPERIAESTLDYAFYLHYFLSCSPTSPRFEAYSKLPNHEYHPDTPPNRSASLLMRPNSPRPTPNRTQKYRSAATLSIFPESKFIY